MMVDDGWWWLMANSREICQLLYTTWVIWVLGDSNDHDFFVGWHQWHQLRTFAAILSSPFSRWSRNSRPELWCYLLAFVWPVESLGAHHASISEVYLNVVSLMIQAFGDMFCAFLGIFASNIEIGWNWIIACDIDIGDWRRLWDHMGGPKIRIVDPFALMFVSMNHPFFPISGIPSTFETNGLSKKPSTQLCVVDVYGQRTIERSPTKSPRLGLTKWHFIWTKTIIFAGRNR